MQNIVKQNTINSWQLVGLIILPIRFVQGWIFWAGGSRRFIYAPQKLDPYATHWLANKLQGAMPGALFDAGHLISYMLQHFWLLYASLIIFSMLELLSGLGLILGCFSRLSAFLTAFISVTLMINFGWEGGTCMDEWTMAVSNFAMALVLILSGSPVYSIDSWLLRRYPHLRNKNFFVVLASGELPLKILKIMASIFLIIAVLFTTATYNYYRGAIFSAYHAGPVSPRNFQLTISNGHLAKNGAVDFRMYVSGGTTSVPSYVVRIVLLNGQGSILEEWTAKDLSLLSPTNIVNEYAYNKIVAGNYGLIAPVSAKATIILNPLQNISLIPGNYSLKVFLIDGSQWSMPLKNI